MAEAKRSPKRTLEHGGGREALLSASAEIISEGGLRELTYRNVAARAGVAHGLVRHYFGSREALIKASLEYCVSRSIAETGLNEPDPQLETFAKVLPSSVSRDPGNQVFQYELILQATRQPELRPLVEQLHREYRETMARELEALGFGHDPVLANLVFAALDGLVFEQVALGDKEVTEEALALLRELLTIYRSSKSNN